MVPTFIKVAPSVPDDRAGLLDRRQRHGHRRQRRTPLAGSPSPASRTLTSRIDQFHQQHTRPAGNPPASLRFSDVRDCSPRALHCVVGIHSSREVPLESLLYISLALFGLLFGSFANVVIWRFPRGESLSHPGSHCPVCETPIAWYDNVPFVSWVALGGRCRSCGTAIPVRYPVVELLSAVLWVLAGVVFGVSLQTAAAVFFFYMLLILSFIDLDVQRLPNALVGLMFGVGVVGVLVSQFTSLRVLPLLPGGTGVWGEPVVMALRGCGECRRGDARGRARLPARATRPGHGHGRHQAAGGHGGLPGTVCAAGPLLRDTCWARSTALRLRAETPMASCDSRALRSVPRARLGR